jgi:hypothetical protein
MVVIFSVDILSKKISYWNVLFSCIGIIVYLYMNTREWNAACNLFLSMPLPCLEYLAIPCDVLMKPSHMSARYKEDIHEALNCQIILQPGQSDGAVFTTKC